MAQYFKDYSTDTQGAQPADTTLKRSAVSGDYTVQTDDATDVLRYLASGVVEARGLAYDLAPSSGITNLRALLRDAGTNPASARLVTFASDSPDNEYGVILSSVDGATEVVVYSRVSGSYAALSNSSRIPVNSIDYYNLEFEVTPGSPNTLKVWYWIEGGTKPATPDIDITNSDLTLTSGWTGHIGFDGDGPEVFFKRLGVGTNGDPAPTEPVGGGTTDDLTANDVSSLSSVTSPVLGQTHELTATDVQSQSETSSPAIGQTHALTSTDAQSTSQVSSPALATQTNTDNLSANDISSTSSTSSPALGQVHNLAANDATSKTETGTPALKQTHALTSVDVSSLSTVSSPALTSVAGQDSLAANDVQATSTVSSPTIGQVHNLTANDLSSASETDSPNLGQVHTLTANDLASTSEVSSPTLRDASQVLATPIKNTKATVSQTIYKAAIIQPVYKAEAG